MSKIDDEDKGVLARLLCGYRWAALATINADGTPEASQVAYVYEPSKSRWLMHLSMLAKHTRNLTERPQCKLVITDPDDGRDDPQTLARIALEGTAAIVEPNDAVYAEVRAAYLLRLPMAEPRFDFGDFRLLTVDVSGAQYVGGFARAHRLNAQALRGLF